jgi:hypothetical protein
MEELLNVDNVKDYAIRNWDIPRSEAGTDIHITTR